jgi:hypothetical protein
VLREWQESASIGGAARDVVAWLFWAPFLVAFPPSHLDQLDMGLVWWLDLAKQPLVLPRVSLRNVFVDLKGNYYNGFSSLSEGDNR